MFAKHLAMFTAFLYALSPWSLQQCGAGSGQSGLRRCFILGQKGSQVEGLLVERRVGVGEGGGGCHGEGWQGGDW